MARCFWARDGGLGGEPPVLSGIRSMRPSPWRYWLLVGVGLGLAGLSKYSAVLTAGGLAAFVLLSPKAAPLAQTSRALCLGRRRAGDDNAGHLCGMRRHGWASFEFQGARGVPGGLAPGAVSDDGPGRNRFSVALDIRAACRGHGERVPPLAGRPLPVSALPQFAADRSVHPDAALGRPWPASLDDARLVLRLPVAGRMGR